MGECVLTRKAIRELVSEDMAWLEKQPHSLEKMHVKAVLEDAMFRYSDEAWYREIQRRNDEHRMKARITELETKITEMETALREIAARGQDSPADNLLFYDHKEMARRLWLDKHCAERALKKAGGES